MRHYLEPGGTMTGKVVWLKGSARLPIREAMVLQAYDPEIEDEDYYGEVDGHIIARVGDDSADGMTTQMMVPHRQHATGPRFWIYKGEETDEDKAAIREAGYLI